MKEDVKKKIILKIALILAIIILFNFSAPTISQASDIGEVVGGVLLTPIMDLLITLGDGAINLIQSTILGIDSSLTKVSTTLSDTLPDILGAIAAVAVIVGVVVITGGLGLVGIAAAGASYYAVHKITAEQLPDTFYLPMFAITPEEMFSNQIALLDVNFFNPNTYEDIETLIGEEGNEQISTASRLQSVIASWYVALRNFALVILLSVLLYTGMKIVISSSSQDKAKYKERLFDWLIAVCLLFFMHYIMAFATTMVEGLSELINSVNSKIQIELPDLEEAGYKIEVVNDDGEISKANAREWFIGQGLYLDSSGNAITDENATGGTYVWYTNLMGKVRLDMQIVDTSATEDNQTLQKLGYTFLYIVLVLYTVAFLVVYIKRLIMLAFLTMIAPLVAMTYSLDKMKDGKAQAFNMWVKEYVFNLLIQPFHLILYTMLVGSAMEFASENMIYAIVAIGFIFQAEKILRRFFGFDQASTLGSGAAIGGALAMAGVGALKMVRGRGSKDKKDSNDKNNTRIRRNRTSELLDQENARQIGDGGNSNNGNESTGTSEENRSPIIETVSEGEFDGIARENHRGDSVLMDSPDGTSQTLRSGQTGSTGGSSIILGSGQTGSARGGSGSGQTGSTGGSSTILGSGQAGSTEGMTMQGGLYVPNNVANQNIRVKDTDSTLGVDGTTDSVQQTVPSGTNGAEQIQDPGSSGTVQGSGGSSGTQIGRTRRERVGGVIRGVAAVGAKGVKYVAPKATRLYVKGALAATAGIIGAAGGLASDNDMNILKYGAAGAGAGWIAGSGAVGLTEKYSSGISDTFENVKSTYTIAAGGEEAEKARILEREEKAAMKDKERQKKYAKELGLKGNEVTIALEQARQYRENGIMDDDIIIKAMKAEGFGDDKASRERMILAGLATKVVNNETKLKDIKDSLKDRGLDSKDINRYIGGIREITGEL